MSEPLIAIGLSPELERKAINKALAAIYARLPLELDAEPEGVTAADPGKRAVVVVGGTASFWLKETGTSDTGWVQVSP